MMKILHKKKLYERIYSDDSIGISIKIFDLLCPPEYSRPPPEGSQEYFDLHSNNISNKHAFLKHFKDCPQKQIRFKSNLKHDMLWRTFL